MLSVVFWVMLYWWLPCGRLWGHLPARTALLAVAASSGQPARASSIHPPQPSHSSHLTQHTNTETFRSRFAGIVTSQNGSVWDKNVVWTCVECVRCVCAACGHPAFVEFFVSVCWR